MGLGQGGASMQAIALFLDLGGDDRYSSTPGATLGQSGSNTYHYQQDHVFSFSLFLDQGGGKDIYSGGNHKPARTNDKIFKTGNSDEANPENSSLYGLFVDEYDGASHKQTETIYREWTDKQGQYRIIARLVSVVDNVVKLEKKDGETIDVPLAKLSQKDRDYVKLQE